MNLEQTPDFRSRSREVHFYGKTVSTNFNDEIYLVSSLDAPEIELSLFTSGIDDGEQVVSNVGLKQRSQMLLTGGSTCVIYWEGAVAGKGTSVGKPITSEGYVELTGYAGSLGGLF